MQKTKFRLTEDWIVVLLGFLIILLAILGFTLKVPGFNWQNTEQFKKLFDLENILRMGKQFLFTFSIILLAHFLMRKSIGSTIKSFPLVFLLTIFSQILAGNRLSTEIGLETVIFSLFLGLLVSNIIRLPSKIKESLNAELMVKIGLVLLGTNVIFSDIMDAGLKGLAQSLIVVLSVWYFAFWLCKKLKVDEELTMMISSAVSICGVSAAIATSGAIKGDSKKLSYVVAMVLITSIPMMIGMPYLAKILGLTEAVTGAWLGGSIDTSGAVVASGSLVGEEALKISTIVKFSQNVLLGIAALAISVYWTYRSAPHGQSIEKPGMKVIWERFPKFVIGFIAASILFSFILDQQIISQIKGGVKGIQTLWFALAFTSIGLETNFKDLFGNSSLKPFGAFLVAQIFNIIITLLLAWWLFS